MNVALIRAHYDPFGGAERFLNGAADAIAAQGNVPTIITRAWPTRANTNIAHMTVNPWHLTSAGRDRGFSRAAIDLARSHQFDLVQSYERLEGCDIFHAVDGVHAEWLAQRHRIQSPWQRLGVKLIHITNTCSTPSAGCSIQPTCVPLSVFRKW